MIGIDEQVAYWQRTRDAHEKDELALGIVNGKGMQMADSILATLKAVQAAEVPDEPVVWNGTATDGLLTVTGEFVSRSCYDALRAQIERIKGVV